MKLTTVFRWVLLCLFAFSGHSAVQADYKVGDIVQLRTAGGNWALENCFISQIIKTYTETWGEKKYFVQHLQLPRDCVSPLGQSGGQPDSMRPYSGPYVNDYDPARYIGTWRLGAETSVTTSSLIVAADNTFEWRPAGEQPIRGRWIKNERGTEPDRVLILKNGWHGQD